jgi:threonine synthase
MYDIRPVHVCELCFGPLEVVYNYDEIAQTLTKSKILDGPLSMWRYADLMPLDGPPHVGKQVGYTPLIRANSM